MPRADDITVWLTIFASAGVKSLYVVDGRPERHGADIDALPSTSREDSPCRHSGILLVLGKPRSQFHQAARHPGWPGSAVAWQCDLVAFRNRAFLVVPMAELWKLLDVAAE